MEDEIPKKDSEQRWAKILSESLNSQKQSDYAVYPELSENAPVDAYLFSPSKKFPTLNLQLTHAVEVPFIAKDEKQSADYTNLPTAEAIERKKNKLIAQGAELAEIVLVIQGYMDFDSAKKSFDSEGFQKYSTFPFKGIYYISPTMLDAADGTEVQHGFALQIKDPFATITL
jgi:hypothetical protein